MNKWVHTLLCSTAVAVAWTTPYGAALALPAASAMPAAQSYADLLEPVANPVAARNADDARLAQEGAARLVPVRDFHHHHHHHHHHHNNFSFGLGFGPPYGYSYAAPYYAPPCHWTWGRPYWNGYRWVRPRIQVCD